MSYFEMTDVDSQTIIKSLGFSPEQFYSLPYHYQKQLVMGSFEMRSLRKKKYDDLRKKIALKQYNVEENVKKKSIINF